MGDGGCDYYDYRDVVEEIQVVILYLYLDESGSLKGDDDHYFVLLAVATTTPRVMTLLRADC